jgi:hypothetical protein
LNLLRSVGGDIFFDFVNFAQYVKLSAGSRISSNQVCLVSYQVSFSHLLFVFDIGGILFDVSTFVYIVSRWK